MSWRRTLTDARPNAAERPAADVRALEGAIQGRGVRLWEVDALRGVAILMMAIFHGAYDLAAFGGHDIAIYGPGWSAFADLTATLFISVAGIALTLSYARARSRTPTTPLWSKFVRRGLWILFWGIVLTAATWVAMPQSYIRFGILHLIGVSIILAYPFLRLGVWAAIPGTVIIALGPIVEGVRDSTAWLLPLGVRPIPFASVDYRPLIPWFGVMLIGVALGSLLYPAGQRRFSLPDLSAIAPVRLLTLAGRHSLLIYITHQPVVLIALTAIGLIDPNQWLPV